MIFFIRFNSGSKAHKTTDKSNDIKAHTNIKTHKNSQKIHRENCTIKYYRQSTERADAKV